MDDTRIVSVEEFIEATKIVSQYMKQIDSTVLMRNLKNDRVNRRIKIDCDTINISRRLMNNLKNQKITHLYQLSQYTLQDFYKMRNFGRRTLVDVKELMIEYDIYFDKEEWSQI